MSEMCMLSCPICGGDQFEDHAVLWPDLTAEWQISDDETAYINKQQGTLCRHCGGNIRSGVLAKAICSVFEFQGTLDQLLTKPPAASLLEINEAGTLHSRLLQLPGHVFGCYPECDLMALPFDDESFEVIVHSDTLEHVSDPKKAIDELRRALVTGGVTVFTVPIIVGRLTRSRNGCPPSFHGSPGTEAHDLLVHTEFGADVWCMILEAGFSSCRLVSYNYPAGIAIVATK